MLFCCLFSYQLSPETFGYTLVHVINTHHHHHHHHFSAYRYSNSSKFFPDILDIFRMRFWGVPSNYTTNIFGKFYYCNGIWYSQLFITCMFHHSKEKHFCPSHSSRFSLREQSFTTFIVQVLCFCMSTELLNLYIFYQLSLNNWNPSLTCLSVLLSNKTLGLMAF